MVEMKIINISIYDSKLDFESENEFSICGDLKNIDKYLVINILEKDIVDFIKKNVVESSDGMIQIQLPIKKLNKVVDKQQKV